MWLSNNEGRKSNNLSKSKGDVANSRKTKTSMSILQNKFKDCLGAIINAWHLQCLTYKRLRSNCDNAGGNVVREPGEDQPGEKKDPCWFCCLVKALVGRIRCLELVYPRGKLQMGNEGVPVMETTLTEKSLWEREKLNGKGKFSMLAWEENPSLQKKKKRAHTGAWVVCIWA